MFKHITLLFIFALVAVFGEEVITLTKDNFQKEIDGNEFILVEFYAPWCGHCKKLAPEYEKAAEAAKALNPKVVLAKVDATAENDLASEYEVKGFPTLKWFVNGKVSDYTGGRTESTIMTWLKKKTGPPAVIVKTASEVEDFKKQGDAVVLGIFKDEAEAKEYLSHASSDDETAYGVCYGDCAEVVKAAGAEASTKLVVLQNFDEGKALFNGNHASSAEISTFVSGNLLPLVIPFSQKHAPKIFGGSIKTQLVVFVDEHESDSAKALTEAMKPVAKEHQGKILAVTIPKSDSRILGFFGVKEEDVPTARIINMGDAGAKKYKMPGSELTSASLSSFAKDYFAGKVPLDLKSEEPIPESEQGPVRVVVGKDFDKIVDAPGKDVLVEFYAPWCGHCKKLEPEYNALGEHFKDNDNIVIAKVDATANEVERVQVSGFPTLKFFPADSSEIIDYDGARDKDGMIAFLEKNAKSLQ